MPLLEAMAKAIMADIKPGMFVGTTAMPQADGSLRAVEVHIFPEAMRGTGEGHRPWDLEPQSTMTNANVEAAVAGGRPPDPPDTRTQGAAEPGAPPPRPRPGHP